MIKQRQEFEIDGNQYQFSYFKSGIITEELTSDSIQDVNLLDYLGSKQDQLVPLTIKPQDQTWQLQYRVTADWCNFQQLAQDLSRADKVRLCLNLLELWQLRNSRIVPVVHPDNILFDVNLRPKVLHRGAVGIVAPQSHDHLFKQLKAFIVMVLSNKYTFNRLYKGLMADKGFTGSKYQKIIRTKSIADLKEQLQVLYRQALAIEQRQLVVASKKQFNLYRWGFLLESVVTTLVGLALIYLLMVVVPQKQSLVEGAGSYLQKDYDQAINHLSKIRVQQMPKVQQLMLAKSYVHVDDLNHQQKANINKSLNMNSDPNYLKYWIYDGQGNFNQSLDAAKYLGDQQLILFSYTKLYSQANNNPHLTGAKKQRLLNKYSKLIKAYTKKLQKE